ncbi:Nodulation efficiency, NfeD [sediment metagenome]|uniref:Nodulation efficiency, NfeD n=1 Tax=sediment metagenome TaxID=749907 RepID=D9PI63_9ZZZZ
MPLPQLIVIVGLTLVFAELVIGIEAGLDLVAIGSILLLSGFLGTVTSITVTLIAATALVVIYFIFGRKMIKSRLVFTTKKTNVDKLIGKTGMVVRSITPDTPGLVRLDDEDWRATAETTLFEKDKVAVESIEGVTLKVTKKG